MTLKYKRNVHMVVANVGLCYNSIPIQEAQKNVQAFIANQVNTLEELTNFREDADAQIIIFGYHPNRACITSCKLTDTYSLLNQMDIYHHGYWTYREDLIDYTSDETKLKQMAHYIKNFITQT